MSKSKFLKDRFDDANVWEGSSLDIETIHFGFGMASRERFGE